MTFGTAGNMHVFFPRFPCEQVGVQMSFQRNLFVTDGAGALEAGFKLGITMRAAVNRAGQIVYGGSFVHARNKVFLAE